MLVLRIIVIFTFASSFSSPLLSACLSSPLSSLPQSSRTLALHRSEVTLWYTSACTEEPVRPSARPPVLHRPERRLRCSLSATFILLFRPRCSGLSLCVCWALARMKPWEFRFLERNTRKERASRRSENIWNINSSLPVSILSLSLSVFLLHRRHFFLLLAPSVPLSDDECPIEEQREPNHCPALDSILLINGQHLVSGHQRFRHAVDGEWPRRAALPQSPIKLTESDYANNKLITVSQPFSSFLLLLRLPIRHTSAAATVTNITVQLVLRY